MLLSTPTTSYYIDGAGKGDVTTVDDYMTMSVDCKFVTFNSSKALKIHLEFAVQWW